MSYLIYCKILGIHLPRLGKKTKQKTQFYEVGQSQDIAHAGPENRGALGLEHLQQLYNWTLHS
jgi:hypothetical protein